MFAWAVDDEQDARALDALARLRKGAKALAPAVWWFEVRNALLMNERRGRLGEADVTDILRGLARLSVAIDRSPDETALLTLTRRHRLTVYDAAYVELAQRQGLPLASLDNPMRRAAVASGVTLLDG